MEAQAEGIAKKKRSLSEESEKSKEKFNHELEETLKKIQRAALTGFVITGAAIVGYQFLKRILAPDPMPVDEVIPPEPAKEKKSKGKQKKASLKSAPSEQNGKDESALKNAVIELVGFLILGIAKQKLDEYLKSIENDKK